MSDQEWSRTPPVHENDAPLWLWRPDLNEPLIVDLIAWDGTLSAILPWGWEPVDEMTGAWWKRQPVPEPPTITES
jgi:hypothetical protein